MDDSMEQDIHKIGVKHLVVPRSKKVLPKSTVMGAMGEMFGSLHNSHIEILPPKMITLGK